MSTSTIALAMAQVVAFFVIGHSAVALLIGRARHPERAVRAPERWLLSVAGTVGWSVLLMLGHLATGGWIFASPVAVPALSLVLVAAAWWRTRPSLRWRFTPRALALAALALVLVALYWVPAMRGGSSLRTGDPPWHLGWTQQLLGGDPVPTGPAPDYARNAYPWGYHSTFATMVRAVPGSDPVIAHEAMHLILLAAIPLGAAGLARVVNPRAGLAAAAAAALIGGFGWIPAGQPDFSASPTDARYGADLVVASPNSVYELLPPALPRELGLVLLACAAVAIVAAIQRRSSVAFALAGIVAGIVGLVSVPMAISALAWSVATVVVMRRDLTARHAGAFLLGAIVTFAFWAGPAAYNFVRYDGFVDVSPRLGVEWPIGLSLASWGLLLPLALGGIVLTAIQPPVIRRPIVAFFIAAVVLLLLSWARGRFGWTLLNNRTLLHQGRFWPPAHLLAAAFAGIALLWLYARLRARGIVVAGAAVVVVLAAGAISPTYASIELTRIIDEERYGFLYGSDDLAPGSFVRSAAAEMDPDDVMLVVDGDLLAFYLWQFSGARIADDDVGRAEPNPWRIRYRTLAEQWYEKESRGSFDFDWVFSSRIGHATEDVREFGTFRGDRWMFFSSRD